MVCYGYQVHQVRILSSEIKTEMSMPQLLKVQGAAFDFKESLPLSTPGS